MRHMPSAHMTKWSGPYDYIGGMVSSDLMAFDDFGCVKPRCYATHLYTILTDHDHMPTIWSPGHMPI